MEKWFLQDEQVLSHVMSGSLSKPTSLSPEPDASAALDGLLAIYGKLATAMPSWTDETAPGVTIGQCRLVEKLAEGGMGVVWLAEQLSPVQRTVAVKFVKSGMNTSEFLRRFQMELEALSRLEHPNIARIYDAGITPRGLPYLVMELVRKAASVTDYCGRENLGLRARLELFTLICEGVQHAHSCGIIHRDLKPSNLLVTTEGGTVRPVIIDFGVARALDARRGAPQDTETGRMLGTPLYMSPEQATAGRGTADARADVYALGCVLYELIAGSPPFEIERFRTSSLVELVRILHEEDPPLPSERLRSHRRSPSAVTGELDCIVMKALEKAPPRRYRTAAALEDDLRRYLRGDTVIARPSSLMYRLRKLAARHKASAAALTVGLASLILLTVVSQWQARREMRERQNAEAILRFFDEDLVATTRESTVAGGNRDPLEAAARRIDGEFSGRPVLAARLRTTLGRAWLQLGDAARASAILPEAMQLLQRELGPDHPETLRAGAGMAELSLVQGGATDSVARWKDVLGRLGVSATRERREALLGLATALAAVGEKAEAASTFEPLLRVEDRQLSWRASLAFAEMLAAADPARAEQLVNQVMTGREQELGKEHPDTLAAMGLLAGLRERLGDAAAALDLLRGAADGLRVSLGAAHPRTLAAQQRFAAACERLGDEKTAFSVTISSAHAFLSSGRQSEAMYSFLEAGRLSSHTVMPEAADRFRTEAWKLSRALALPVAGPWLPRSRAVQRPGNSHWYQRIEIPMLWTDAEAACRALGGHLATIDSPEENRWVHGWFAKTTVCWLGAEKGQDDQWHWVTGEPFSHTNWAPGEPSNSDGEEKYLNFGSSLLTFFRKADTWNDHRDTGDNSGWWLSYPVCEWEPPATAPPLPSFAANAAALPRTSPREFGGHWYGRINVAMPWEEAKAVCEALGGHLVCIGSAVESEFICNQFASDRFCWLGGSDDGNEGNWRWVTGEPWNFTAWGEGEPSNEMGFEHFLLTGHDPWNHTRSFVGTWNDAAMVGDWAARLITCPVCEWDYPPSLH